MKKWLFSSVIVLFNLFFVSTAGAQNDVRNSMVYRLQKANYNRAVKYNDVSMAINALYNMVNLEPGNDSLLYALEYIYFENRQYFSAILVANDVLMLNPGNLVAQEIKAYSLEQIGAKDKAMEEYESLFLKNNDLNHLYKVAILQYEIKRLREARTNVDILLTKKEVDEIKLLFSNEQNEEQEVPMRASLHNLKGMIEKEQGNSEEAKKQFGIALEIQPDFYLARQNLDLILNPKK